MYKLTKPQKLIYDMHKFAGGAIAVICGSVIVNGNKDIPCLVNAVNELYRLNDALRMRILETEDGTKQAVHDYMEQDIEVLRFASREQFDIYANAYAAEPLDLYGPLCDIKIVILNDSYGILAKLHHIIGDAWTLSLLASQFCTLANGETPEAYSYTQYIGQEEAYLQSPRYQKDKAFFLEQFRECHEVTYLSDKQSDSMVSRRRTFVIDNAQADRITTYVREHNTSVFVLFMTALAVYMNRTKMNAERFYIGTAVLNRAGAREKNTMGMFINSAPMLIKLDNSASFVENLAAVQHSSLSAFRHQKYNYGDVLADIRKEYGFTEKLYDVMLSYQNATITGAGGAFESSWYHSGAQTESLQVHIDDRDNEGIFRIHFDYQTAKFTDREIERLYEHITNLLFNAIENDEKKLYELKILSEVERHRLLYEFNDTAADHSRDKCVHQLFEEQAKRTPGKTAVIACDQTLTYGQLNEQANRIAHSLIAKGVKAGDIVAFALPRKSYLISTIFGILKAGAAYLPIDPDFPEERTNYMLEDSGAKLFITEADINVLFSCEKTENPIVQMSEDCLCYCIYTSGSTGMPKGALLTHRNIVNYISYNHNNIMSKVISKDVSTILAISSVTFDIFTTESLLPLAHGLIILLASEEQSKIQSELNKLVKEHPADLIQTPPSKLKALLADEAHQEFLQGLKVIILGGEMFDVSFVNRLHSVTSAKIYNCYGPTEASVTASISEIKKNETFANKLSHSAILHQLFEEHAQKAPDKVAVIACDRTLTYAELNEQANYIASALIKRQISTGDIVAFALPRKSYLVAVILGILKTGAAYLPIDPDYPQDRIEFMLADSGAKLYITESNLSEYLTETASLINGDVVNDSNANCYCLYTSGTTGKPKATTIKHYNLNNFCNNADKNSFQSALANTCAVVLAQTTVIFDISIFEIFLTLLNGLTLVLASDKEITSPSALAKLIISNRIDAILTTPTKMSMYLENQDFQKAAKQLKLLMIGAETFPPDLLKRISEYSDAIVFNGYGPTETTIGVSFSKLNGKCVHQLFEEQAQKVPDKVAVIACDRTLTYEELNEQANKIAHGLIERGVGRGDIVAFILPRKSYLLSTMLGILKAGAAYMPIDPDYPQERIDYMLEDSRAKLCVTEEIISEIWNNDKNGNLGIQCVGEDLCYCIYTSGSTGKPKGTLLTHGCVVNYISNNNKNVVHKIILNSYDSILSVTTVGFDIFVTESLLPLANGLQIIFANEEQATMQTKLNELLSRYPADVIQTTPTKMRSLISDSSACGYLNSIKAIILGGEAVDGSLVDELQKRTSAHIFNIYGPTETTVWSTNAELYSPNDITIGKPIANTQIHIVDKYMYLAPIGTTGELCIAGDGVGAGYLNRPEMTAEKFIDNPFGDGRLYKTGDLAYWREDGNIVYVGRNDFQVKIRGLRIELGEIESAICSVVDVLQAVVVVRKDNAGRQMICAFYTESAPVSVEQIKTVLREKLPRYMMPHIFTLLPQMPLTSSGKINRKALPEVDLSACGYDTEYVKPEGALEKHLAQTMEEVLGYSPVGRNDSFFDIGGDSLKAIEYVSKAYSEGIYFALQNVFDYPTVKLLAECIESGNKHEVSFDDLDFTRVNGLLSKNNADGISVPKEAAMGNILLAGATGYLGIHILADFLELDSGTAYCLVRGEDEADSKRRFAELLQFYFGDKYSDMHRIVVVCADLQKDCFGLPEQEYSSLLSKIDTVINAAASVKHYGSYRYFHETNVETVNRLIKFCMEADAKLVHTSTLSVSGNSFADHFDGYVSETEKHFYETSLYIGQALDNVYARSKFEAERAVLEAMGNGLRANIMRMGNLTNRLSDGVFQKNHESNAFLKRVMAILEMGVFPEYLLYLYAEFTPIDEAANAVMTIARHFSDEYTVFHINSTKVYYMDKLLSCFKELGHDIKVVDGSTFADALRKTMEQSGMEHIFETFINDMDESGRLNYDSNIRIENDFTVEYLRRLGFEWTELGLEYLRKYISYFENIGCLEGKKNV